VCGLSAVDDHLRAGNLNLLTSYTWSHEIDDWCASGNSYGNNGRPFVPFQPYVIHNNLNKASGDLDVRQRWVSAFVLNAPFGHGQRWGSHVNSAVNQAIAGWQVSGIPTLETGQWFTVNKTSTPRTLTVGNSAATAGSGRAMCPVRIRTAVHAR
jgi:hypothetical protein